MKAEIENAEKLKEFKPFEITLTVESVKEARLLFHVFNRVNLKDAILTKFYCDTDEYDLDIENQFSGEIYDKIEKEIKRQGFEI